MSLWCTSCSAVIQPSDFSNHKKNCQFLTRCQGSIREKHRIKHFTFASFTFQKSFRPHTHFHCNLYNHLDIKQVLFFSDSKRLRPSQRWPPSHYEGQQLLCPELEGPLHQLGRERTDVAKHFGRTGYI